MADITRNHEATSTFTHEIETIFSGTSFKKETAWGTEAGTVGTGFSKFYGFDVTPTLNQETKNIEVKGITLPTGVLKGIKWTTWSGSGSLGYKDFALFTDILSGGQMLPNSYTLYHQGMKALGCAVSGFSISGSPMEMTGSVNFVGKDVTTGVSTPTYATAADGDTVFFQPDQTRIYIDDTEIQKVNAYEFNIDGIWNIANYINPQYQSIAQDRINGSFSMTIPLNSTAFGYFNDNAVHEVKIENNTVLGDKTYWFTIEFNTMLSTPDSPGDTDRLWTIKCNGAVIHDETKAVNIQSGIEEEESD